MADKKPKKNESLTVDDDLLTDEERLALEEPEEEPEGDEDEEGKKDESKEEKSTPDKNQEEGDKKDDKPGEGDEKKEGDRGDKEGDQDPLKDAKPVQIEVNGEVVEGWISKSGKYIIPYPDVEKRDEARRTLKTANEALEASNKALMAQLHELMSKSKEETKGEEKTQALDFKALGKKLYESEDDAAEVLEQVFNAGHKAGRAGTDEGDQEGQQEQAQLDPNAIASQVESKLAFKQGLEAIVNSNEKFQDKNVQFICYQIGMRKLGEAIQGMDKAQIDEYTTNADNLLKHVKEAADETLNLIGGGQEEKTDEEKKAEREEMRKEVVAEVTKSLNLSEADRRTLGDVGGSGGSPSDSVKELDNLQGEELEDALENLSPQEKDDYLNPKT